MPANFDPSATSSWEAGLFGIPSTRDGARVIIIPVPWEVTTSYGSGTSKGPLHVLRASPQIDLFDLELGTAYEAGFHLLEIPDTLASLNDELKPLASAVRAHHERNGWLNAETEALLETVNRGCATMSDWVHARAREILDEGRIPAVLGGDHSTPEGNIRAVCELHGGAVGILHIDAHADLRESYQGFTRSHASIMNNVMRAPWKPAKLVQVGIRDFSREEFEMIEARTDISTFLTCISSANFSRAGRGAICAPGSFRNFRKVFT
ncbi:MAG: hypothetical protein HC902_07280 [Calothrix sp. SM1_5_4]|nr:hypothetical protein [Calothrix sp. SM1_5_4]